MKLQSTVLVLGWNAQTIKNSNNELISFLGLHNVTTNGISGKTFMRYGNGLTTNYGTVELNFDDWYKFETSLTISTGEITYKIWDTMGNLVENHDVNTLTTLKNVKYLNLLTSDFRANYIDDINVRIVTPPQTGFLPNGDAPVCVQWDGNVVSNNVFTTQDQTDLTRVKAAGFNCISVDARANFIQTGCTNNPAADFTWTALDDLVTWAGNNNLYINFQPVYDTPGYIASCVDSNSSYSRASYQASYIDGQWQVDFNRLNPNPTRIAMPKQISIWDEDLNTVLTYWLTNFAQHFADKNQVVFMFTTPPNEGFANGLMDNNNSNPDLNTYWQGVYLPSQYADKDALNADWGTSYGAFTNVPVATDFSNIKLANHFWKAKSNRTIDWYVRASQILKQNSPATQVTTVKLLPDYFYPNGNRYRGYTNGIDVNDYIYRARNYIDWVSIDPYPDQAASQNQSVALDARYGLAKSIADIYSKPIFIGELFPSVNGGDPETDNPAMLAQMILQAMAYVGDNQYSGVRGMSIFSWKWSGTGGDGVTNPNLSIRGSTNEDMIRQLAPYLKIVMKNVSQDYNNNLYFYDNTGLNVSNNRQYLIYEQFFGFINQTHRIKDYAAQYLINGQTTDTNKVVYANPIYDKNANVGALYNWVNSGGTLLSGFRTFDENETSYDEYGTTYNSRPAISNTLFGATLTAINNNMLLAYDYNIVSTKTILTDPVDTKVFSCRAGSTCDAESSTLTTGTSEVKFGGGASSLVTRNTIGYGNSLHFGFNLYDLIYDNNQTTTTDTMFKDIFDYFGVSRRDTNMNNIYGWNSDKLSIFNAYNTSTYTFNFDVNTPYTMLFVDGNTITVQNTTSGHLDLDFDANQSILLIKGIDLASPETSFSYSVPTDSNIATVTLTCVDDYSGCSTTQYRIDDGNWTNYTSPFTYEEQGHHTIDYNSIDVAGNAETMKTSDLNMPSYLVIKFPIDEDTLNPIDGNWRVDITGAVSVSLTKLDGDTNYFIPLNQTVILNIVDMNNNYFNRNFYLTLTDSNYTLQPYLVSKATGLLTTINAVSATTNQPIQNVTFKLYKYISGLGKTYVEEIVTDSKGQGLVLLVLNSNYNFEAYYGGALIKDFNITATTTTIYFILDLGSTATNIPVPSGYSANWTPGNGLTKQTTGQQAFTQTLHNFGEKSVSVVSSITQNGVDLDTPQIYTGSAVSKIFTYDVNWIDVNAGTVISSLVVTVDGNTFTFTQSYTIIASWGGTYTPIWGLQHGLKSDMQCVDDPLLPCYPLLVISIIISIALGLYASYLMGQFAGQSAGVVFLIAMILFTWLTWIPIWLTAGLVIIILAFLVNERRS